MSLLLVGNAGNVAPPLVGNVVPQATGTNSLGTCKNAGVCAGNVVRFSRFFALCPFRRYKATNTLCLTAVRARNACQQRKKAAPRILQGAACIVRSLSTATTTCTTAPCTSLPQSATACKPQQTAPQHTNYSAETFLFSRELTFQCMNSCRSNHRLTSQNVIVLHILFVSLSQRFNGRLVAVISQNHNRIMLRT